MTDPAGLQTMPPLTMPDTFATERLHLRRSRDDDAPLMAVINRDPEVMRYLNRPVDDAAVAAFHGLVCDHWAEHGFGFYALEDIRDPADELISIIHPDNVRSRRLATGLGMTVEREVHNPVLGRAVDVWVLSAAARSRQTA